MVEPEGYRDWSGIAQAIKAAATQAAKDGSSTQDVGAQIMQARHDRFLSRIFADGDESEWLLKGGTAMLARVPRARSTSDLDIAATASRDLDDAQAALEEAARRDLGDHLRFELTGTRRTGLGDNQPGVSTRRLSFTCFDATTGRKLGEVPIDLVVGPAPVGTVEVADPANRIHLPRPLATAPYRLFPLADQVAEKVCATMMTYDGRPSSRVKDLVDIVTIAHTQWIDLHELQKAIATKRILSKIPPFDAFTVPAGWDKQYRALAARTPAAGGITDLDDALALAGQFINPALAATPLLDGLTWRPGQGWADEDAGDGGPDAEPHGEVHVRAHTRSGYPIAEHWRGPRGTG